MKIINFKASNFEGECNVDEEFVPLLQQVNTIAIKYNLAVIVTSSYRKDTNVKNAIVTPAKMSNHLIAQAVDINIRDKETEFYYNSKLMGDGKGKDEIFLRDVVKNTSLRWGQSFSTPDSVHLDSGLNINNPKLWMKKYKELHS